MLIVQREKSGLPMFYFYPIIRLSMTHICGRCVHLPYILYKIFKHSLKYPAPNKKKCTILITVYQSVILQQLKISSSNEFLAINKSCHKLFHTIFFYHFMARYGTHVLVILTIRAKILDQPTNVFEEENKKTSLRLFGFIPKLVVLDIESKHLKDSFPSVVYISL